MWIPAEFKSVRVVTYITCFSLDLTFSEGRAAPKPKGERMRPFCLSACNAEGEKRVTSPRDELHHHHRCRNTQWLAFRWQKTLDAISSAIKYLPKDTFESISSTFLNAMNFLIVEVVQSF